MASQSVPRLHEHRPRNAPHIRVGTATKQAILSGAAIPLAERPAEFDAATLPRTLKPILDELETVS